VSDPDPRFDAVYPSGQVMVRSCREGYLHSVVLGDAALEADAGSLARAILAAAQVSHAKAVAAHEWPTQLSAE
jgi:hypothetical protein